MKKLISLFLITIFILSTFTICASAKDVSPEFTKAFFPEGKIGKATDVYYQIKTNENNRPIYVYMWLTQPDEVINMYSEMNAINDNDKWIAKYNCFVDSCQIQIDCKVDNGNWHYQKEWDVDEYPQPDQPYDLTIRQRLQASTDQKTYVEGGALIDPWYGQDDENAGYLKPVIKMDGETPYLDLDNHTLTLRARYILSYHNDNMSEAEIAANNNSNSNFLLSDWSDEISIGKNGSQADLVKPEKIDVPVISDLSFVKSTKMDDGPIFGEWKVYVDFPKSNGDAVKYYSVKEDASEPLCAVIQYRVQKDGNWGEWKDSYWANPTWLFSGWKTFETEDVDDKDTIEFRAYLENNVDSSKNSDYTESLFCNAGSITQETSPTTKVLSGRELEKTEKTKCKVCGICPVQPLGICLFIWIAIILIVIIIIVIIINKSKKKKEKGE